MRHKNSYNNLVLYPTEARNLQQVLYEGTSIKCNSNFDHHIKEETL